MRKTKSPDTRPVLNLRLVIYFVVTVMWYSPSPRGSNVWIMSWKMVFLIVLLCKEAELPPRWRDGFNWGRNKSNSDTSLLDNCEGYHVKALTNAFICANNFWRGGCYDKQDCRRADSWLIDYFLFVCFTFNQFFSSGAGGALSSASPFV